MRKHDIENTKNKEIRIQDLRKEKRKERFERNLRKKHNI